MVISHSNLKSESRNNLLDGSPPLNYSLHTRTKAIAITWTIISFDSCLLPIILFYSLWFGTTLSHSTGTLFFKITFTTLQGNLTFFPPVSTILTAVFGLPSLVNFSRRVYFLCKKDSKYRPIGSKRGWVSPSITLSNISL